MGSARVVDGPDVVLGIGVVEVRGAVGAAAGGPGQHEQKCENMEVPEAYI